MASLNVNSGRSKVRPAEAKAVWDSMEKPTDAAVARKLQAAGRSVSKVVIGNWRKRGWLDAPPGGEIRLDRVRGHLDEVGPAVLGDPVAKLGTLIAQLAGMDDPAQVMTLLQDGLHPIALYVSKLADHELVIESHKSLLQVALYYSNLLLRKSEVEAMAILPEVMNALKVCAFTVQVVTTSLHNAAMIKMGGGVIDGQRALGATEVIPPGGNGHANGHANGHGNGRTYPDGQDPFEDALQSFRVEPAL